MELQYNQDGSPYVMWGNNKIQLEKQPIIQEKYYLDKAEKELREFPENVEKALAELRKLLKGEPTLNIPLDDDEFLMKFLRPCKLYAESAFKRIQAYYKFRLNHEDYCSNLTPTSVRSAFKNSVISILAPRDQHGRRIMFVQSSGMFCWEGPRSPAWDPREVSLMDVFRGVQLGLEAALVEPRTQVAGVIVVFDVRGLSFSQILCFTPSFAKMIVDWIQDCAPIRLKAVHIINQPILFNMLFTIFKPFLREKLRSRIFFHGSNKQSILSHVASEALRKRHGGSLPEPDIPGEVQWKMIHHYEEDFKVANSHGYADSTTNNNNKY